MGVPYAEQLTDLDRHLREALPSVPVRAWSPPVFGPESHFRNKAKLVVGGRRGEPTLGILDPAGHGVDLRECGLYEPGLHAALPHLADFIAETGLTPYDVPSRTGELKHLLVTHSPDDELMVRFVLRSTGQLAKLERALPELYARLPQARVVTVNLLPEHRAATEGPEERVLSQDPELPMRLPELTLYLGPQAFFQTNTTVATMLYRQAQQWVSTLRPKVVWDLFCGVGGFGLHVAAASQPAVLRGIEISPAAVAAARHAAAALDLPGTRCVFEAADAEQELRSGAPGLLIVNPPRRGIGALAERIEQSAVPHVLYSSCNAASLARDLSAMPSLQPVAARAFAMFPQTRHHEVLVLLRRSG